MAKLWHMQELLLRTSLMAQEASPFNTSPPAPPVPAGAFGIDTSLTLPRIWSKSASTDASWTIQNMYNLRVFNVVRDFGANGDGVADNRAAINAAIAAAKAAGGGIIYFPPGLYNVVCPPAPTLFIFDIDDCVDITFLGDGASSQIGISGDLGGGSIFMFVIHDACRRIRFDNLAFVNNGLVDPGEQVHIIQPQGVGADTQGPTDIDIYGCWFFNFTNGDPLGDAIRMIGELAPREVRNVRIIANMFETDNSRSCIGVQRGTHEIIIAYNWLTGPADQAIDFEPTGSRENRHFNMYGNIANQPFESIAITLSGDSSQFPHQRSVFASNVVKGTINALGVKQLDFCGNVVYRSIETPGNTDPPVGMLRYLDAMNFVANVIRYNVPTSVQSSLALAMDGQATFALPGNNRLADTIASTEKGDVACNFASHTNLHISGSIIKCTPTTGNAIACNINSISGIGDNNKVYGSMFLTGAGNMRAGCNIGSGPGIAGTSQVSNCYVATAQSIAQWPHSTTEPIVGNQNGHGNLGAVTAFGISPPPAFGGYVVAANVPPYDLADGDTLDVVINGGAPQTATFTCTVAARTGAGGTYPTGFVGGEFLTVEIDNGVNQSFTFTAGDQSLAQVINRINLTLTGAVADDNGGELRITSDVCGNNSAVEVKASTAAATLGMALGTTNGTGNVGNIDVVDGVGVVAVVEAGIVGCAGDASALNTTYADGAPVVPVIWSTTAGPTGTIEVTGGTANAVIGFPTAAVAGYSPGACVEGNSGQGAQMVLFTGTTPQGNVAAGPGSLAMSTVGGVGTTIYRKETGTGRTGWVGLGGIGLLEFGTLDSTATTTALFLAPFFGGQATPTVAEIQFPAPRPGRLQMLRLTCTAGVGAGTSTYTVRVNGVNTALAVTVNHTATSGSNVSSTVLIAAGDLISVQVTKVGAPGTPQTNVFVSLEIA